MTELSNLCGLAQVRAVKKGGGGGFTFPGENDEAAGAPVEAAGDVGSSSFGRFCLVGLHKFLNSNFSPLQ